MDPVKLADLYLHCFKKMCKIPKKVADRPAMTIAVDLGRKATKQTNSAFIRANKVYTHFNRVQNFEKLLTVHLLGKRWYSVKFTHISILVPKFEQVHLTTL